VAAKKSGLHEVRTRVMCNLPVNNVQEEKAFFQIIEYLNQLRHEGVGVTGYTYSETRPVAFHGFWWPDDGDEPIHDQIVLCTVDYLLASGSAEISQQVRQFKQTIRRWYRHFRSPQDEVWVVAHPIIRQD
jgi:hypothetical protein